MGVSLVAQKVLIKIIQSKFSDHNEITFGFSETTQLNNIMLSLPYFCDFTQMCCYRAFLIGWLRLMVSLKKKNFINDFSHFLEKKPSISCK